jgi:hypothetical protein
MWRSPFQYGIFGCLLLRSRLQTSLRSIYLSGLIHCNYTLINIDSMETVVYQILLFTMKARPVIKRDICMY